MSGGQSLIPKIHAISDMEKWCESSRIFYSDRRALSGNQLGTGAVTIPVYWAVEVPKQGGGNRCRTVCLAAVLNS